MPPKKKPSMQANQAKLSFGVKKNDPEDSKKRNISEITKVKEEEDKENDAPCENIP